MATYVYIITLKCLEAFSTVLYLCFTYCWFSLSTCSSFGCSIQRATCLLFDTVSICDEEFPLERANIINPVHLKKSAVVYVFTREVDGEEEGIKCNWSVYKTTPHARKSKKGGSDELASLEEANDDSESLTAFLVGFEREE
ncbi:hypothetical protein NC653_027681 [Populus alba x Populus x berolinensis]|uniref:Uncharacterized protein n=1 Tax=Populus alba x Populus x berolinensis TaxID=444605 RepID=A0AAD6M5Z7_9ROSI|nr:hypothetical protein NC653_027681 [Populus alba x Populus x berolinensis]